MSERDLVISGRPEGANPESVSRHTDTDSGIRPMAGPGMTSNKSPMNWKWNKEWRYPEALQPALEAAAAGVDVLGVPCATTTLATQRIQVLVSKKVQLPSRGGRHGAALGAWHRVAHHGFRQDGQ